MAPEGDSDEKGAPRKISSRIIPDEEVRIWLYLPSLVISVAYCNRL